MAFVSEWICCVDVVQVGVGREVLPQDRRMTQALDGRIQVTGVSVHSGKEQDKA